MPKQFRVVSMTPCTCPKCAPRAAARPAQSSPAPPAPRVAPMQPRESFQDLLKLAADGFKLLGWVNLGAPPPPDLGDAIRQRNNRLAIAGPVPRIADASRAGSTDKSLASSGAPPAPDLAAAIRARQLEYTK
jgi:hypothetical protein